MSNRSKTNPLLQLKHFSDSNLIFEVQLLLTLLTNIPLLQSLVTIWTVDRLLRSGLKQVHFTLLTHFVIAHCIQKFLLLSITQHTNEVRVEATDYLLSDCYFN